MRKIYNSIKFLIITISILFGSNSFCSTASQDNSKLDYQLQTLVNDFRIHGNAPATVLSIRFPNNEIHHFLSGTTLKKTSKNPDPPRVTINNLFQIGSITKSFIAVIILQLEAEDKLSINDTIADMTKKYGNWLPKDAYIAWKNITIKQLLNMTSGIFSVTEDPNFNEDYLVKFTKKQWNPNEELKFALKHKPYFNPGTGWHYSDTNYMILGLLIEAVTHHSVEFEINKRLLKNKNLVLKNTYYFSRAYPKNIMNKMAHGYAYPGDFSPPATPGSDMTDINMSIANAAGCMISNTQDIINWVNEIFTGRLLPKAELDEMLSVVCASQDNSCHPGQPMQLDGSSEGFSLGLAYLYLPTLGPLWMYVGTTGGYYSAFLWVPQKNITLAMTTSSSSKNNKNIIRTLIKAANICL